MPLIDIVAIECCSLVDSAPWSNLNVKKICPAGLSSRPTEDTPHMSPRSRSIEDTPHV